MINKPIVQITEADLQSLIHNSVIESKTLEYKQSLPGNTDSDKKEFLADITSFANTSGGDIIFGISEDPNTGAPNLLGGLDIQNIDQEASRLDNMIRDGIEPRISSISIKPIGLRNSKTALIIRIPKSWAAPHRVKFGRHNRFYARSTNGKYEMDVVELRNVFNLTATIVEKINNFRADRISKILANETIIHSTYRHKIVLHLLPMISFNPAQVYDINQIASHPDKMIPMHSSGWSHRYNLEGFLTYSTLEQMPYSYVQLYRNGIIEAVDSSMLEPQNGQLIIPSRQYEEELIKSLRNYLSILKLLNVEPPAFIFLSMLNVKDYTMVLPFGYSRRHRYAIDREVLLIPEIAVENWDLNAEIVLKPCFDYIWNACGLPKSLNYNDVGEWSPR